MTVDIYIKERDGSRENRVPWLPEEIEYESGGMPAASYDIMNRGEVAVPTGTGLATVSWSSQFPGAYRTDSSMQRGAWQDPQTYHNILLDWLEKGTALNILVTGYPINLDVHLENYNAKPTGGFGDLEYDVSFIEDRDIIINSTKTKNSNSQETKRTAAKTTTYTIKPGDTLWSIAQRFLGSGAKWSTIYNANKEIIESTAKKRWKAAGIDRDSQNGHWIFPGTVITIPSGTTNNVKATANGNGAGGSSRLNNIVNSLM